MLPDQVCWLHIAFSLIFFFGEVKDSDIALLKHSFQTVEAVSATSELAPQTTLIHPRKVVN